MVTAPLPNDVIDHLTKIAADLLSKDVQMYEKGTCTYICICIYISFRDNKL